MDKLRMKGRLGVAVVLMALAAMFAMPAFAAAATFSGQYPAPAATLVAAPAVVAVDVAGAPALKATTADIKINGVSYPTFVKQAGASAGAWTSVVSGTPDAYGQYRSTWTWVGGANANATVYCYPPTAANANGAKSVVMFVRDSTGATVTASWSYTVSTPAVVVPPVPVNSTDAFNTNCTGCHGAAPHGTAFPYNTAGAGFGANCSSCHYNGFPAHGYVVGDSTKHASLKTALTTNSAGCASCHGSNLFLVGSRSSAYGAVSVPGVVSAAVLEHKGCSCHDYNEAAAGTDQCEDCHTNPTDPSATYPYHVGVHTVMQNAIAANSAGCVSCHGSDILAVAAGQHAGCSCHAYHEAEDQLACEDCHVQPMDASAPYPYHVGAHDTLEAGIAGTRSAECVTCHGSDLFKVGGSPHTVDEHKGCSCHAEGQATASNTECVACHSAATAPHGFVNGVSHDGGTVAASGHNTATNGKIGGLTKWDGSEGVVVKDSAENPITQEWPLPTASVFWSQSNLGSLSPTDAPAVAMANRGGTDMASKVNTTVGWDSVITCNDCHTNLDSSMGPQGANVGLLGLDPNFPDDWTKAEITSFDPTGMRSIETTVGSANPYYTKLGSNVYMPMEVENAADPANPWAGTSIETTIKPAVGTDAATNITVYPGGFYGLTSSPSNGYSMGNVTGRFICQKCHKLTNSFQGLGIEGNGRGARDNNLNYMGMSNEAHMEHHNDMITGQGNCVSCHIAIPHGWKRPRLLVYESDPEPYKVQWVFPNYRLSVADAKTLPSYGLSKGNWGYIGPNGTAMYGELGAPNAFTDAPTSSHLEKLDASAAALKELAVGPAAEFKSYDAQNSAAFAAQTGINVTWSGWDMAAEGVEWLGNPNGAKISATYWDGATNAPIAGTEAPIQNNCNACTSANAGTHAPQVNGNTTNEGVQPTLPYWK